MLGNGNYPQSWFNNIAQKDEVRFVIPLTRSLNTQADIMIDGQHFIDNAEIIPTAENDPLLEGVAIPQNADTLVLSANAAQNYRRMSVIVCAYLSAVSLMASMNVPNVPLLLPPLSVIVNFQESQPLFLLMF